MGRVYQRMTKTNEAGSEKNMGQRENGTEVKGSSVDLPDVMEPPANIYMIMAKENSRGWRMGNHARIDRPLGNIEGYCSKTRESSTLLNQGGPGIRPCRPREGI